MEIRTLQYFLAVAREQNMTGAANLLHITQPTLSRQMADLEQELGKKLFIRTNRSTLLTEDGIRLRQRAEEIVSLRQWSQGRVTAENLKVVGKFDLIANAAQLIRTGITSALGIDELFQLQTPDLVFIPLEPAVTVSCLVAWKKYQLLSPTCEAFLKCLKEEIHLPGKD